jgi:transcriptional regulator with XRE-family HTH domain
MSSVSYVPESVSGPYSLHMQTIGDRIKATREALGLSQDELGKRVDGVSREAVSQWESDGTRPRDARLEKIAAVLGVDYTWLRTGKRALGVPASDPVVITLKTLRKRARLSPEEVAGAINVPVNQYREYEERGKSLRLPSDIADALTKLFSDRGVEGHHVLALVGGERGDGQANGGSAERPRVARHLAETVMVPQLDVHASAGHGSEDPVEVGEGAIIAHWQIPTEIIRQFTQGAGGGLYWITNRGNSMEPVIAANTPVLVNTQDRTPSPPGVFCVWDGIALVVKNVQAIPFSDPVRVKISSENPSFDPYERVEEEACIWGRVVANMRAT